MYNVAKLISKRYLSTRLVEKSNPRRPIEKILIANRGEIACRVVRTARRLGIRTAAIYSDADVNSLHVEMADEAHHIGPAPSQQSYLRGDKIIRIAKDFGCQAIHPGYGFLSESVEFAELCQRENVIFMGPPASAIRDMGIKSTSKAIMAAAGVPIINGYHGDDQSNERLQAEAETIGFPLMIKAVRGGGGKGMRIAEKPSDFFDALESARTESQKAFGDSSVLLERFVRSPRHVEVQIFADQFGNAVYLFERDCSVQRRHQKIIEEAPAPGLSEQLRIELGTAAVRAAKAVGYVGAGTVEFILDKNDLSFHFMEMNTRLQVEHPITEMITGLDLVEWQIRVASGEPLPLDQSEITRKGHSFEARIYAEDPRGGFLPGAGHLAHLTTPETNENVRVETGVRQGDDVSVHYDPMIAKLVVWGETRAQALNSLVDRLRDYQISGLETNVNFLITLAQHPSFQEADVHTGFIPQHSKTLFPSLVASENILCQAAVAFYRNTQNAADCNSGAFKRHPFSVEGEFRLNHSTTKTLQLKYHDKVHTMDIQQSNDKYMIKINNGPIKVVTVTQKPHQHRYQLRCNIDGFITNYNAVITPEHISIFNEDGKTDIEFIQPKFLSQQAASQDGGGSKIIAPMPGIIDKILVKPNETVAAGQPVAVLIAMKMEHVLKANRAGIVKSVYGQQGANVGKGTAVVSLEEVAESNS